MKCAVVYFSQTGNTEKMAKAIQRGIADVAGNCDLIPLKDANPKRLYRYDLIGLGSAVFGVAPSNVCKFVDDMRFVGGKHAFIFCTHGTHPENFFPSIYPNMVERGMTVIGMANWYGNCYLLHMPEPYPTAGHPDAIDEQEAEQFGRDMVQRSAAISAGDTSLIPSPPPPPPPPPTDLALSPSKYKKPGEKDLIESFGEMLVFHADKCRYPKCRLCMEHCPVNGIDLSMSPRVIADPCVMCEFCTRVCPTGALDMDEWVTGVAEETTKMVETFLFKPLDQAEKEGKFRRLVPKEEISLETRGYMLHKKHPNWIVGKGPR
jgi:ferredoxin/flavodoxin